MFYDTWIFDQSEASAIVGLTVAQIGNWYDRYDLFPGKARGRGNPVRYDFRELVQLGAVKALVDHRLAPAEAVQALRARNAFGSLVRTSEDITRYPGSIFFTQNGEGLWVGADDAKKKVYVEVRLWPIFDEIYPLAKNEVLNSLDRYGAPTLGEINAGFDESDAYFQAIREKQGA